ncbi:DUF4249 domain-containing protein [Imperialibacter roseus]|mgnify:CR=1 FL=1|uniref:DUF4249 domain-containing protein n=1 Tax=Imperialibacter roseus TaxID=1324217 RepID=A0ABZ0IJN5_9BACT|nr:DUF4249 domain-containing protein [Imperialibacter roseus]WOK04766.1 DUF4249 domain-containing protein [Imperialibacter roseus]
MKNLMTVQHMPKAFYISFLLFLASCITPFDPDLTQENPKLSVEGTVTDLAGPYAIKLSYSTSYTSGDKKNENTIRDAKVFISDSEGNEEELTYSGNAGTYVTAADGIQGVAGRYYTLRVELSNGKAYESYPELMPHAPEIDTLYAEYRDVTGEFVQGEFDVYLDATDPAEEENYYLWKWKHYKRLDYCLTYIQNFPSPPTWYARYCCDECFEIEACAGCVNIGSDALVNGGRISRVPLMSFEYDSREPYYLQAEQYSLTESAYKFWKTASDLINNAGGVFDKPPVTVKGNLFNVADPDEQVLGYFGASSVKVKAVYFRRDNIPSFPYSSTPLYNIDTRGCQECEESIYRTGRKPSEWDNAPTY